MALGVAHKYFSLSIDAESDTKGLRSTFPFVVGSFFVMCFQLAFSNSTSVNFIAIVFYIIYAIRVVYIYKGIGSPVACAIIVMLMYSYLPMLPGQDENLITATFGHHGGYYINAVANFAFVFSAHVSTFFIVPQRNRVPQDSKVESALIFAATLASSVSCLLSAFYIIRFGAVGDGSVSYGESFTQRQETGAGILTLSVPFGMAAAALLLTREKLTLQRMIISFMPFVLMFFSMAQRKYLIIPALLFIASRVRISSITTLFLLVAGLLFGITIFGYFGYIRIMNYALFDAFNFNNISSYFNNIGQYISGETKIIHAIASSSYYEFMSPLPYFGDYFQSWQMSVPQFFGQHSFTSSNVRFAFAMTPVAAAAGGGWGYSFFGEAYMVGGFAGVFLATSAITLFLRYIYVTAVSRGNTSFFYMFMICGIYHSLWFQRNAFAFFLKEYIVYQGTVLVFVMMSARFFLMFRNRQKERRAIWTGR